MSFKKVFILSLFFLMGLGSSFAIHAATVECGNLSAAKTIGASTLSLTCGDQNGFVKNEAALDYLKVVVTKSDGQQKVYTLKNPPGGIREYYAGGEKDPWVLNQLRGKLAFGDTVEIHHNGYGLKSGTSLYNDVYAYDKIGVVGGGSTGDKYLCLYTFRPSVITTKACGTFCTAVVDCNINGKKITTGVLCKTNNNGEDCPSATKCAADEHTDLPKHIGAGNYDKFGNFHLLFDPKWPIGIPPADLEGQSDSTGGNTSSGNDAGGGGTLQ